MLLIEDLEHRTIRELRALARSYGIPYVKDHAKAALIQVILAADAERCKEMTATEHAQKGAR